mmetsp:Transcript_22397/g.55209  ORF Transcript_22397/g.55209 Transcript_22397/m.55209 type:complete len:95 (+) Transcript_22397:3531-3815(+)
MIAGSNLRVRSERGARFRRFWRQLSETMTDVTQRERRENEMLFHERAIALVTDHPYGAITSQTSFKFTPLACETFGRWSPATEAFLHKLAGIPL